MRAAVAADAMSWPLASRLSSSSCCFRSPTTSADVAIADGRDGGRVVPEVPCSIAMPPWLMTESGHPTRILAMTPEIVAARAPTGMRSHPDRAGGSRGRKPPTRRRRRGRPQHARGRRRARLAHALWRRPSRSCSPTRHRRRRRRSAVDCATARRCASGASAISWSPPSSPTTASRERPGRNPMACLQAASCDCSRARAPPGP